jgi:cytochrome c556
LSTLKLIFPKDKNNLMIKKAYMIGCLACIVALAQTVEPTEAHKAWMKDAGAAAKRLRQEVNGKDFQPASKDAAELLEILQKEEQFWTATNTADARKSAQDGRSAADRIVSAAKSENTEQLADGFEALTKSCQSCHSVHREKLSDGTFRIIK